MRGYRKDANHGQVVEELGQMGVWVLDLAQHGLSVDLLVGYRGQLALVEIKAPGNVAKTKPRKEWLTDKETEIFEDAQYHELPYIIALTSDEIINAMQLGN